MIKEILYYTDNRLDPKIIEMCQQQLLNTRLPIISVSLKPLDFGSNIVLPLERGWGTYFTQIFTGLAASKADVIFFAEHDVLYPASHFDFTPLNKNTFYYDHNWWKIRWPFDNFAVHWDADQVSGLCCYRELALDWYQKKVESFDRNNFDRKFEPGSGINSESWNSAEACVDIRQEYAQTKNKWSIADFRDKRTAKNFQVGKCPEWAIQLITGGEQ
jgi:hypothetical protein